MLPTLFASFGLALLLGIRHGFDADHLAAIDGLSRLNVSAGRPRLAALSGLLFSTGHGAVVMVAALALRSHPHALPAWLEGAGSVISICLLALLGFVNLRQASKRGGNGPMSPLSTWLLNAPFSRHAGGGLVTGALFAVSFDTLTIAAWFSATLSSDAGLGGIVLLAGTFVMGMIACDGINGMWMTQLIKSSEAFAAAARRFFSALVAGSALAVALLGLARLHFPMLDAWAEHAGVWISAAMITLLVLGYQVARRVR